MLPHFLVMGVGALIWYNQRIGDSPIVHALVPAQRIRARLRVARGPCRCSAAWSPASWRM